MEVCKYCGSNMMPQDNDKIGNEYCRLHVCVHCKAVHEVYTDLKGNYKHDKWWNPTSKEFEEPYKK